VYGAQSSGGLLQFGSGCLAGVARIQLQVPPRLVETRIVFSLIWEWVYNPRARSGTYNLSFVQAAPSREPPPWGFGRS
jgi:hypothetical protein